MEDYQLWFLLSLIVMCVSMLPILIWRARHTENLGLFKVIRKASGKNTLHINISKCPTGDMASACIFIELRKTLRELRSKGYKHVHFETHMIHEEKINSFLHYIKSEGFICEHISFRKTLSSHSIPLKVGMFLCHGKKIKTHPISAKISIKLLDEY